MTVGETIETAIRKMVEYCHKNPDPNCSGCPFRENGEKRKCGVNMGVLEDLVHFTDTEIIPKGE